MPRNIPVSITVISELSRFDELEAVWNGLIRNCSQNPIFFSGFVKQFIEFRRSKGWCPLVLLLTVDGRAVGIAPLMMRTKYGIRFVKFLLEAYYSPDFIVEDQYRELCFRRIIEFVFETLHCEFMNLTFPGESPNLQVLREICRTDGLSFRVQSRGGTRGAAHCVVPIKDTWEKFRASKGRNFRKRISKIERQLDQAGSWRIIHVDGRTEEPAATERINAVERESWKEVYRRTKRKDDADLSMILKGSSCTARTQPDFEWWVNVLELNGEALAYALFVQYKGLAFLPKTSFDESYERFSPGLYVINESVHELFNRGNVRALDLCADLPMNRRWTSVVLPRTQVFVFRKGILPMMILLITNPYVIRLLNRIFAVLRPESNFDSSVRSAYRNTP